MKDLVGRTALVTGASRGLGVYIAHELARAGMNLVLTARSAEGLERVRAALEPTGVRTLCLQCDVANRVALERLAERSEGEGDGVSVLVNNAALEGAVPYESVKPDAIDQMIEVNVRAPMMLTRLLLPRMLARGAGHVVNIASVAGLMGTPYDETYSATKHALVGFTRSLRATAHGEGWPIGVSAVCPGFIAKAGMYEDMRRDAGIEAPASFGTSPPELVAREVVRAIRDDVPEMIVNPTPMRPMLVVGVFSPRMLTWIGSWLGGSAFFKRMAEERQRQSASS